MISVGMVGYGTCIPKRLVSNAEIARQINGAPENQADPKNKKTKTFFLIKSLFSIFTLFQQTSFFIFFILLF